jgi:hypothetical protein
MILRKSVGYQETHQGEVHMLPEEFADLVIARLREKLSSDYVRLSSLIVGDLIFLLTTYTNESLFGQFEEATLAISSHQNERADPRIRAMLYLTMNLVKKEVGQDKHAQALLLVEITKRMWQEHYFRLNQAELWLRTEY